MVSLKQNLNILRGFLYLIFFNSTTHLKYYGTSKKKNIRLLSLQSTGRNSANGIKSNPFNEMVFKPKSNFDIFSMFYLS